MDNNKSKRFNRTKRHKRLRIRIKGTIQRPRVSVFKSNRHIFVQVIDDTTGKTLISSDTSVGTSTKSSGHKVKTALKGTKTEIAKAIGSKIAEKMKESGISEAVFDRGGFKFHGRIKAVAESLRKGGIKI